MAELFHFVSSSERDAVDSLSEFIRSCRQELGVFGHSLNWESNHWPEAGVQFGNVDQKTRKLDPTKAMGVPYLDFAKAYFRYQQGHNPTGAKAEILALKCIERALSSGGRAPDISDLTSLVLDQSASLASQKYSEGTAYTVGRELERLARFVSTKQLISRQIDWKSPIVRPADTVRTGPEAKAIRDSKLPQDAILDVIGRIFSTRPELHKDIYSTSTVALLLCAPSRINEINCLRNNCEISESRGDGKVAYGWRFQAGKGGGSKIKWIPTAMVSLAKDALERIRTITSDARELALWLEEHPDKFYRHGNCPDVSEAMPLSVMQSAAAIGIPIDKPIGYIKAELRRFGVDDQDGGNTLESLNRWVHENQPTDFPFFDKQRNLRYSEALFCFRAKQLRTDMPPSPVLLWRPSSNTLNDDLGPKQSPGGAVASLFDRYKVGDIGGAPWKMNSHQIRHLLNTIAQRGGMSQAEIALWSSRVDVKQNRTYDHMSEFELAELLRAQDPRVVEDKSMQELAIQISKKTPMTVKEFNNRNTAAVHVTLFGFCEHDFVMSPCMRFRDCLNCNEHLCVKGDNRVSHLKQHLTIISDRKERAQRAIDNGEEGADRWYENYVVTETRLAELIAMLENPEIPDGTVIRLNNKLEFNPVERALEARGMKALGPERAITLKELIDSQGPW